MAPLPTSRAKIKWHDDVFVALHALMVGAILNVLVFVQMAAGRSDNSSLEKEAAPPSSDNRRPDVALFLFGVLFFLYLLLKGFQLSLPLAWFSLKRILDEFSLLVGALSLGTLLSIITRSFTLWIAVPAIVLMIVGRIILGIAALEWLYVRLLHIKRGYYLSISWVKWCIARARVGFSILNQAQREEIDARITHQKNYWDRRIRAANYRADKEKAKRNKEEIDDKAALDTLDNNTITEYNWAVLQQLEPAEDMEMGPVGNVEPRRNSF